MRLVRKSYVDLRGRDGLLLLSFAFVSHFICEYVGCFA